ncbi:MAG: hypothetical protein IJF27_01100 [Oscillospiraceae bacterium]|nr:hypothetical protein [Oscillospiraceae bacterium]MBQ3049577.1 hypothetical protein [Oscillospiraceae bacterium]MBQ9938717.1 hypothetical protein [Oscillospiraceae bacterium]
MKKSFLAAFGAIIFSVLVAVGAAELFFKPNEADVEQTKMPYQAVNTEESSVPQEISQTERPMEEGFYITSYEGEIAVFRENDDSSPIMVFEGVYLHQLPEYDRQQIEKKIYAKDYAELTSMLEDYIS